jgi:hypothetical protein
MNDIMILQRGGEINTIKLELKNMENNYFGILINMREK